MAFNNDFNSHPFAFSPCWKPLYDVCSSHVYYIVLLILLHCSTTLFFFYIVLLVLHCSSSTLFFLYYIVLHVYYIVLHCTTLFFFPGFCQTIRKSLLTLWLSDITCKNFVSTKFLTMLLMLLQKYQWLQLCEDMYCHSTAC